MKPMIVFFSLVLACAFSGCGSSQSPAEAPLQLVRNGKTDYVIVVDKNAPKHDRFAAEELQKYLKQSTGADFPIVTDPPANGKAIVFRPR